MEVINGIRCNLKGFAMGIRTPRLLMLGLIRFAVLVFLTIGLVFVIFAYHTDILALIWNRPENRWLIWLWYAVSILLSLILSAVSTVISYIFSQLLFSVFIMDAMSRITERILTNESHESTLPFAAQLVFLIKQEIPRAVIPILISLILMVLGWLTPLGPIVAVLSSAGAAVFLAWDHTDLLPARQMHPFRIRFGFLMRNLPFHLGFGLLFLVPVLNIFLLAFASVGGTIYQVERESYKKKA